jgi:hypothetical protein
MKIKSNVRAGSGGASGGGQNGGGGAGGGGVGGHSSQAAGTVNFYVPLVNRCVGI